jgi:hypothetical protein
MANRSKKVVLSARIDPYLKAALELSASVQKEKIVKLLEQYLLNGLEHEMVANPFGCTSPKERPDELPFMDVFVAIWSENEVLYKVRAGALSAAFAGTDLWEMAMLVIGEKYFKGDFDLFGDLNGAVRRFGFLPPDKPMINLRLVEAEWAIIESYVSFLQNNKPFQPPYLDYKRMLEESQAR